MTEAYNMKTKVRIYSFLFFDEVGEITLFVILLIDEKYSYFVFLFLFVRFDFHLVQFFFACLPSVGMILTFSSFFIYR